MASESPLDPVEVERPFSHTEGRHGLFISGRAGGWGSYQLTGGRGQKPKSQWHDRTRQTIYATCERFVPKNIVKTVNFRRLVESKVKCMEYFLEILSYLKIHPWKITFCLLSLAAPPSFSGPVKSRPAVNLYIYSFSQTHSFNESSAYSELFF